jgi:hypothetical protein
MAVQQQGRALLCGQSRQRAPYPSLLLHGPGWSSFLQLSVSRCPPLQPRKAAAAPDAPERCVCGHRVQPGAAIRDPGESIAGAERSEKGLLCEFLGPRAIFHEARQVALDGSLMLLE